MLVMPIYQTCLLTFGIVAGMICLNEAHYYSWYDLLTIFLCIGLCVLGTAFLLHKKRNKKEQQAQIEL